MFNPEIHHRRSIRLRDFDYSAIGAYFVTICTQGRECLFGGICDGAMVLNEAGHMLKLWWQKLPEKFDDVIVDSHITMPNHFHGIIRIVGAAPRGRPVFDVCPVVGTIKNGQPHGVATGKCGQPHGVAPTLGDVMDWFKTMTTNAYIRGVKDNNWPPFPGRLWQRNYYERIIRDDNELAAIREYIQNNPMRWAEDKENPDL